MGSCRSSRDATGAVLFPSPGTPMGAGLGNNLTPGQRTEEKVSSECLGSVCICQVVPEGATLPTAAMTNEDWFRLAFVVRQNVLDGFQLAANRLGNLHCGLWCFTLDQEPHNVSDRGRRRSRTLS